MYCLCIQVNYLYFWVIDHVTNNKNSATPSVSRVGVAVLSTPLFDLAVGHATDGGSPPLSPFSDRRIEHVLASTQSVSSE